MNIFGKLFITYCVLLWSFIIVVIVQACGSNPPPRPPTMQEIKTAEKLANCLKDAVSDAGTE